MAIEHCLTCGTQKISVLRRFEDGHLVDELVCLHCLREDLEHTGGTVRWLTREFIHSLKVPERPPIEHPAEEVCLRGALERAETERSRLGVVLANTEAAGEDLAECLRQAVAGLDKGWLGAVAALDAWSRLTRGRSPEPGGTGGGS